MCTCVRILIAVDCHTSTVVIEFMAPLSNHSAVKLRKYCAKAISNKQLWRSTYCVGLWALPTAAYIVRPLPLYRSLARWYLRIVTIQHMVIYYPHQHHYMHSSLNHSLMNTMVDCLAVTFTHICILFCSKKFTKYVKPYITIRILCKVRDI